MSNPNILRTIIALCLIMTYEVGWSQEQPNAFSLQEAITYALDNNQTSKNARLEMEIADRKVQEIIADGLPQVNANADLAYNFKIQRALVPANVFDPNGDPNDVTAVEFGVDYASNVGLTVDQMIFDGSFFIGLQAAKTFTELSKKDHIKNNIDIAEAVSKAYYGVLVNRERLELVERNFSRTDSLLRDTKVLYDNGFAEKIDVSRVQVQYNNLKVEKENFQAVVDLSESLLKFQMGLDPKQPITLTDEIDVEQWQEFQAQKDFTYDKRIEYSQLNVRKELNKLDIRNVQSLYVPKINAYASYGQNTGAASLGDVFSNRWFDAGVVGLRASMPIFDGLRKRRIVQQKRLQGEQIDNQFEILKYNIDIEVQQSTSNYKREVERMEAQKVNMQLAREVYDVAKLKFDEGVGSNIEVIDADASYKQAQTNYYNALYDALISKISLQKAYGILL